MMQGELSLSLLDSLTKAASLIDTGVLPARSAQQRTDSLEDTIWNWLQEFLYHLNGHRIGVKNSLEDLKHILEDHKVIKLHVEQANQVFEGYPKKLKLPQCPTEFYNEQLSMLTLICDTRSKQLRMNRKTCLNLDPEPHSRNRAMQKLEICQLYKTHYGYLAPRVKNPKFFGESQMEEMKKQLLKMEGDMAAQNLTITSLRKQYQAIEQRLQSSRISSEQIEKTLRETNEKLASENKLLEEQVTVLQSSANPLQSKDTLRSRLTTRSSFRGASSQPPPRDSMLGELREEREPISRRNASSRAREYFELSPMQEEKSYHSSRESVSATLRQVQALREMILRERKLREELETRLNEKAESEHSFRALQFSKQTELEDYAALKLHQTKLEYEEKFHRLHQELNTARHDLEARISNLISNLDQEKKISASTKTTLLSYQEKCLELESVKFELSGQLESQKSELEKVKSALEESNRQVMSLQSDIQAYLERPAPAGSLMSPITPSKSRLERSASSASPNRQNAEHSDAFLPESQSARKPSLPLLDLSLHDQLFKTGPLDTAEVVSALSRRFDCEKRKDEEIQTLKEKLHSKRNEIAIMQERELAQKRSHHAEISSIHEDWAREKGSYELKLVQSKEELRILQENFERLHQEHLSLLKSAESSSSKATQIKTLQHSVDQLTLQLSETKADNLSLRQLVSSTKQAHTESERSLAVLQSEKQTLQMELQKHMEVHKTNQEQSQIERVSQLKSLSAKQAQLEGLLASAENRESEKSERVREMQQNLQDAEEARADLARRLEFFKQEFHFEIRRVSDKLKRGFHQKASDLEDSLLKQVSRTDQRASALKALLPNILRAFSHLKLALRTRDNRIEALASTLTAQTKAHESRLETLVEELHSSQKDHLRYQEEFSRQVSTMQSKLEQAESESSTAMRHLRQDKENEIQLLREELEKRDQDLAKYKRLLDSSRHDLETATATASKLKGQYETQFASALETKRQLEKVSRLLAERQEENELEVQLLRQKLTQEKEELQWAIDKEKQKLADFGDLDKKINDAKLENSVLVERCSALKAQLSKENESMNQEIKSLAEKHKSELFKKDQQLQILESRLVEAERENSRKLKSLTESKEEAERELASMKQRAGQLQDQLATSQTNLTVVEQGLQQERAILSQRLALAQEEHNAALAILQSHLDNSSAQLELSVKEKQQSTQKCSRLATDLDEAKKSLRRMATEHDETLQKLRSEFAAERQVLLKESLELKTRVTELQGNNEQRMAVLERKLAEQIQLKAEMESQYSNLKALYEQEQKEWIKRENGFKEDFESMEKQIKGLKDSEYSARKAQEVQVENWKQVESKLRHELSILQGQKEEMAKAFSTQSSQFQEQISALKTELSKQAENFRESTSKLEEQHAQSLAEELETLQSKLRDEYSLVLSAKEKQLSVAQQTLDETSKVVAEQSARIMQAEDEKRSLERIVSEKRELEVKLHALGERVMLGEEEARKERAKVRQEADERVADSERRAKKELDEANRVAGLLLDAKISEFKNAQEAQNLLLENTKREMTAEIHKLREDSSSLKSTIHSLENELSLRSSEIAKLKQDHQEVLTSQLVSSETELTKLKEALSIAEKVSTEKTNQIADLQTQISSIEGKLDTTTQELAVQSHRPPKDHKVTQTEVEVCFVFESESKIKAMQVEIQKIREEAKQNKETLSVALEVEKVAYKELQDKHSVDKRKLLEKLAWLEQELARQKDQILDKLMDIKSLRQSRDEELAHFKISVEEFNRQLEEERRVFNLQLKELDEQKRVQFDMLTTKVKELEMQRVKEREIYQSFEFAAKSEGNKDEEQRDFEEKDKAIKSMIEQYKLELDRLKAENADLRSENFEAAKSIREFLSRMDPDESPEQLKGFKLPEALERLSQRVGSNSDKGVDFHRRVGLARTQSVLNVADELNDTLESEQGGYKRPSTQNELIPRKEGHRMMGTMSATSSPVTKRLLHASKVTEAMEESEESEDSEAEGNTDQFQLTEKKFILEVQEVKTQKFETPRITVYKDKDPLGFKLGRGIPQLATPKRGYKPKFTEILNAKDARDKIRSHAEVHPIHLTQGRQLLKQPEQRISTLPETD